MKRYTRVRSGWRSGTLLLAFVLLLTACAEPAKETKVDDRETQSSEVTMTGSTAQGEGEPMESSLDDVVAAHNKFGLHLHHLLKAAGPEDENVFVSPLSVSMALSMAYNGARGETAREMAEALQLHGLDLAGTNAAHRELLNIFSGQNGDLGVDLKVANGLWHREQFKLGSQYVDDIRQFYDGLVQALDFAGAASVDVINGWVSDQTEGLIDNLIERLEADLVTLLVNTVYFKGMWTTPFESGFTRDDTFHTASGAARTVPFMYRDGRFEHRVGANFEAVRLPYGEDERIAMYVFLPDEGISLKNFAEDLADDAQLFDGFTNKLGEVHLPRLDVQYKANLNDVLVALGMETAFHPGRADFTGMTDGDGSEGLYIGDVVHQSVLKVDEEGTEAAAATSVGIRMTSMPQYEFRFTADRPFSLALRDDVTGSLLFVGSIADAQ